MKTNWNLMVETATQKMDRWDKNFLRLAYHISHWSKDATKIGCVAIGNGSQVLAQGYNGFPRNIAETVERFHDKTTKYEYTVHAEMNMICNATLNGVTLKNSVVYIAGLPPCIECTKCLIQVGVQCIVIGAHMCNLHEPWKTQWEKSKEMLAEASIPFRVPIIW